MPERPTAAERVAANVKRIRTQRGWTRGKLANRAGLPESKVSALEDGRQSVTPSDVHAVAAALDVPRAQLVRELPDASEVQPLSDTDLLAWAVVLTHRARQERDGLKYVLQTYPPCPTCGEDAHGAEQVTLVDPNSTRLTLRPCGHIHMVSDNDMYRLWRDMNEMVADVVDRYDSRLGETRTWTTEEITHEARRRVDGKTAEGEKRPVPARETVQLRPDPRQPAYDAVYENIRSLGEYLPPDTAHRNALIWRAVQAALDVTPVGRCMSSHCVDGDHIIDLGDAHA
ncbi:helix-turn-helix domain-containing protein [Streptomyces griseus]|uniref:helix-turn-helix domain-containing protein n=1 Tax=Streptomyces griseus TaxID=1911 RepID=UPI00365A56B5